MNIKCFTVYICSINCPRVKWCPITLVTIQIIPYFEMNLIWSEKYTPKNNYENTAPEETEQTTNQMTILCLDYYTCKYTFRKVFEKKLYK